MRARPSPPPHGMSPPPPRAGYEVGLSRRIIASMICTPVAHCATSGDDVRALPVGASPRDAHGQPTVLQVGYARTAPPTRLGTRTVVSGPRPGSQGSPGDGGRAAKQSPQPLAARPRRLLQEGRPPRASCGRRSPRAPARHEPLRRVRVLPRVRSVAPPRVRRCGQRRAIAAVGLPDAWGSGGSPLSMPRDLVAP